MYKRYHTKENYTNEKIKKTKDKIAKDKFQEYKNKRTVKKHKKSSWWQFIKRPAAIC